MDSLKSSGPQKIGPFEIVARLGTGGMGVVYLAQQDSERVALKVVAAKLSGDASARTRFLREAQTLRLIKNPFVAQIVDSSDDADFPWIAVEFVSGPSMKELVEDRGPLDTEAWWATALALASALKDTHSHGVTHRDIKPANVLSSETGPKLIDFGIALGVDDTSVTATGVLAGSPAWLSPEQFDGYEVGSASDMFSLGSLLVFLGTGISPWGDSAKATSSTLMKSIISREPQFGDLQNPQQEIVRALLSKNPSERPSAVELIDTLTKAAPEGSLQRYKAWVAMQGSPKRRAQKTKNVPVPNPVAPETKVPTLKDVPPAVAAPSPVVSRRPKALAVVIGIAATVAVLTLLVVGDYFGGEEPAVNPGASSCPAFFPTLSEVANNVVEGKTPSESSVGTVVDELQRYDFLEPRIETASGQAVRGLGDLPFDAANNESRLDTARALVSVRQHLGEQGCWPGFN